MSRTSRCVGVNVSPTRGGRFFDRKRSKAGCAPKQGDTWRGCAMLRVRGTIHKVEVPSPLNDGIETVRAIVVQWSADGPHQRRAHGSGHEIRMRGHGERMNKAEARQIMSDRVRELRTLSYERLLQLQSSINEEIEGASGARYQLEVQAFWDDKSKKTLRIVTSIDDGGLRAFAPMTESFIVAPDGSFVGE